MVQDDTAVVFPVYSIIANPIVGKQSSLPAISRPLECLIRICMKEFVVEEEDDNASKWWFVE